ncbi:transglycosylase domain-containing protein [Aetokthonos hydrillicola Thurmond2011]|jgi:peptidoglycan glycosyltransferase|uniref:Transglycosylase domain-containing protein n=1 Tax=Aetokthonos hydrillicola Thurmond2011 TaxID=2712845 RepID=A0AAP5M841_9CYAN|nr:transglycosylase domain-containing protein [Aetokthonos hydrillicola]MBO3461401.1 FHA domain-containing protein [Aetokthonos hydrillicola CCALA 1050]MBW4586837.1 transglycosylase domain-containing protein [Aetokthonos hydrillicola CCALA 1050]MDR9895805.1 transglycosylase domain-containing protein [Aetokthonos hydrillicola Thurmond2011]
MSSPQPPQKPQTLLGQFTQAVHTIQARVDFSKLALKPNARVPELWVQDAGADKAEVYPLLGDRYILGRSSKSCDIVVRNPVVSQVHLSLSRDSTQRKPVFFIKDENSTNGIYRGKRRVHSLELRHGDVFTLGPPELAASVRLQYVDPPPAYVKVGTWAAYGVGGVVALIALAIGVESTRFSVRPLPEAKRSPVVVYARDGVTPLREPRTTTHEDKKRLQDFGPFLPAAVIASEDSRYYWHFGVDPLGVLRAVLINTKSGDVQQGASTVTQQVARSLFRDYVGRQDSLGRKFREAVVALKLETFYSKDEILLTYLNRVFIGADTYGFEDASRYYFNTPAKDLTLAQAATLVAILPAPNNFDFCGGDHQNKLKTIEYRNRVLRRMLEMGKIKQDQYNRARRSPIDISRKVCEQQAKTIAPYFYSYVFTELESLLGKDLAQEGNFIIETQLDKTMQAEAEEALRRQVKQEGKNYKFSSGAVVTLDSSTGGILAMVGGLDYKTSQFNRAVQAQRQPGSTFKLFTYTAAMEAGISPETTYSCDSLKWQGFTYKPCRTGASDLSIATGLALSENPIAFRVAKQIGLDRVAAMAKRLGIKSPLQEVPGLVIGQSVVNVLEMTGAFGSVSNKGIWNRPHAISRILDSSDCRDRNDLKTCRVIYSFDQDAGANKRVLKTDVADTMTSLLRGVITNGTGRSAAIGEGEAGKTGTTNNNVDLWFIGFIPTRRLVTGIWLGNDNNSPTTGSSAQAAELWGSYMGKIAK